MSPVIGVNVSLWFVVNAGVNLRRLIEISLFVVVLLLPIVVSIGQNRESGLMVLLSVLIKNRIS